MPGDYSRFTDDESKRRAAVLMQQGKVQLDADWNEQAAIQLRRDRLQSLDIMGNSAVPRETTPNAFKIMPGPGPFNFTFGAGRMYVGGLLAETMPGDTLTYRDQPFFRPALPPALPAGRSLVYLDVFQRELTYIEDPDMLEPALNDVDTGTRVQTIWQLRTALLSEHPGLKCDTNLNDVFPPTDAKLTVAVNLPPDKPDPCQLPEVGGFFDVENRHYRVEVHGTNKIKFARDPVVSAVETNVLGGGAETVITVKRIGRDPVLRFEVGNFVELVNDERVLNGVPGIFGKIKTINEASRQITILADIKAADCAANLHPYLVRWDSDLKPIPTAGLVDLEAGIQIKVTGTRFRNGDYWNFPARAATRSAGPLVDAPPRGVKHHYAALATIDVGSGGAVSVFSDCRVLWPPECDCECNVCVTPESHKSGVMTIQMAIDKVKASNFGGKICIQRGVYNVSRTIEIKQTRNVSLAGHGLAQLVYTGDEQHMLLIEESFDTTVENLELSRAGTTKAGLEATVVTIRQCWDKTTTIRDCTIYLDSSGIGISLERALYGVQILNCTISAAAEAIGSLSTVDPASGTTRSLLDVAVDVDVRDCTLSATQAGVRLLALIAGGIHVWQNRIEAGASGVRLEATAVPNTPNRIEDNEIRCNQNAIGTNSGQTTIANNRITGAFVFKSESNALQAGREEHSGIAFYAPNPYDSVRSCIVTGNRISNVLGAGILIVSRVDEMLIKMNVIDHTALAGILLRDGAQGSRLDIDNNEIHDVAMGDDPKTHLWHGIRLALETQAAIIGNRIELVGLPAREGRPSQQAAGISASSPFNVRIHENHITGIAALPAPPSFTPFNNDQLFIVARREGIQANPFLPQNPELRVAPISSIAAAASVGIEILPPFGTAIVTENVVVVDGQNVNGVNTQHCYALRVRTPTVRTFEVVAVLTHTDQASRSGWMYLNLDSPWIHFEPPRIVLIARANHFECRGPMNTGLGIVEVDAAPLVCTFGGNVCLGPTRFLDAVTLTAHVGLVVDSNQLPDNYARSMSLFSAADRYTVVGNVVQTGIFVNGSTLPPFTAIADPIWIKVNRT